MTGHANASSNEQVKQLESIRMGPPFYIQIGHRKTWESDDAAARISSADTLILRCKPLPT
jgi:hypothetical protein